MSYSNAVSKGKGISNNSQRFSKNGSVSGTGNTGIYPKLPPTVDDFPPLSNSSHGHMNATPVAANRATANYASATSPHTSEPGVGHGEYVGQKGDGKTGLNLGPGEREHEKGPVVGVHNKTQDGSKQGNADLRNIGEMLEKSDLQDREVKQRRNDFDYGPSDHEKLTKQGNEGLQNIGETLLVNSDQQDCEKSQGKNDFDYGQSGQDKRTDGVPNPHVLQAGAGQQNFTSQQDKAVKSHNASFQGQLVSVDKTSQQDKNQSCQDQNKNQNQNSFSKSNSRVDWKGREPTQGRNPSQDPKRDNNTHGQGNTKNHGNRSQGSRRELTHNQENINEQTRPESFREDQKNAHRNFQQNKINQEEKRAKESSGFSTEQRWYSHQTEEKRRSFEGGARPRRFEEENKYGWEVNEVDPDIIEKYKDDDQSKFEFFWQSESVYSQWHKKGFTVEGITYMCAEQFMMHRKAILFEDYKTARKIMETRDPRRQKKLGRQVANFIEELWQDNCDAIVEEGNMAKFSQCRDLFSIICSSNPKILVEASPMDKIWGIGLDSYDPRAWNRAYWQGENKLGKALTKVRIKLMLEKKLISQEERDRQLKELMR